MPGSISSTIAPRAHSPVHRTSLRRQESPHSAEIDRLLKAARRGDPHAYYALGSAYALGDGVDIDLIEAHRWYNLAAMAGIKDAQAERAALAADMLPSDIAEAQRLAREWIAGLKH